MKLHVVKIEPHRIELSDGSTIDTDESSDPFDEEIIEKIFEEESDENSN